MDITQHPAATTYLSKVSQKKSAVKNFISWKSSQSPSIRHRANIREHSKHRYIQPSCMAAEHGLCARLPPSFGHYTALNIVGKDPTDQSTSWMSTTDEPSDHEPMLASPVHVCHLPLQFCQILLISPPCLGPRRAQILFLNITSPLKPGQYALSSYVAQSVR
jgi:hypothetical protein